MSEEKKNIQLEHLKEVARSLLEQAYLLGRIEALLEIKKEKEKKK